MTSLRLRSALFVFLGLFMTVSLGGCGDPEPTERKAFIEFLQTRIISKSGVHVPQLTNQEKEKLGRYVAQYEVLESYHNDMNKSVVPLLQEVGPALGLSSIDALMAKRASFSDLQAKTSELHKTVQTLLEKVKADYAAIKQPDDLKPVYEAAYDRLVTQPSATMDKFLPVIQEALQKYEKLADFLDKNKDHVKLSGMTAEIDNQQLLDQFNAQMQDIQATSNRLMSVQNEMRKLIGR
jgi:Txe/YoeB family toxin of Txe-Axe toxin-antitoxin module